MNIDFSNENVYDVLSKHTQILICTGSLVLISKLSKLNILEVRD